MGGRRSSGAGSGGRQQFDEVRRHLSSFDPQLAGYWGTHNLDEATEHCLAVIAAHPGKVDGIKVSLLSKEREIAMRRRLPPGVRMYTGDRKSVV